MQRFFRESHPLLMKTESQTPAAPINENSFAALFEESLSRQEMRAGEVITAEVIRIDQNFVVVNAGLKSESFISADEFKNDRGEVEVKVGDYVTVAIEALPSTGISKILSLVEILDDHGGKDDVFRLSQDLHTPFAELLLVVKGAGHLVHLDKPETVGTIGKFLATD